MKNQLLKYWNPTLQHFVNLLKYFQYFLREQLKMTKTYCRLFISALIQKTLFLLP